MQCPDCSAPGTDILIQKIGPQAHRATCRQCSWSIVGEIHGGYFVPIGTREREETDNE